MEPVWKGWRVEIRQYGLVLTALALTLLGMASFLFASTYHGSRMDATNAGQFGDFIGGCFGPVFSLIGIGLLIVTIREQREAVIKERLSGERQGIEQKYFALLKMHRNNVSEMFITEDVRGRKCFVLAFRELQRAYGVIDQYFLAAIVQPTLLEKIQLAYLITFYGIGKISSPSYRAALKVSGVDIHEKYLQEIEKNLDKARQQQDPYTYFDGHQSRFGHYYRHLFQLMEFVELHGGDDKKTYGKTIRAQLSTHEQVLFLVNSFTSLGWPWWSKKYILDYKLVKNIPPDFLSGIGNPDVVDLLGETYFEFQEERSRPEVLEKLQIRNSG